MKLLPKVLFTGASLPLIILFLNPISITFRLNIHYSEHIFLDIYIKFATIFILGTTEIPDKKNYDIFELRLSVEAAKNLYTGKVNSEVVNQAFMTAVKEVKIAAVNGVDQETLDNFNQVLLDLMQTMVLPDDKQDK